MNKHRFIILFENTLIISIIGIIIYFIISFAISIYSNKSFKLPKFDFNISIPNINTDFLLDKFKENKIDNNITFNTISSNGSIKKDFNETNSSKKIKHYSIIEKDVNLTIKTKYKIVKVKNDIKTLNYDLNKSLDNIKKDNDITVTKAIKSKPQDIQKEKITKINKPIKTEKIDKKLMLNTLRQYIKTSIKTVRNNVNHLNITNNNSIRIRITVFKNGSYKRLKYLSGNESLIDEARIALDKTFPIKSKEIIKSQFPRYIRFKINFK